MNKRKSIENFQESSPAKLTTSARSLLAIQLNGTTLSEDQRRSYSQVADSGLNRSQTFHEGINLSPIRAVRRTTSAVALYLEHIFDNEVSESSGSTSSIFEQTNTIQMAAPPQYNPNGDQLRLLLRQAYLETPLPQDLKVKLRDLEERAVQIENIRNTMIGANAAAPVVAEDARNTVLNPMITALTRDMALAYARVLAGTRHQRYTEDVLNAQAAGIPPPAMYQARSSNFNRRGARPSKRAGKKNK